MKCRPGCGACCIAPSISSPIPGMVGGKPAGVRCIQLTDDNLCRIFGLVARPLVCSRLRPGIEICGRSSDEALSLLSELERCTLPHHGQWFIEGDFYSKDSLDV
jgi:Fe-S-cluster containining protein